MGMRKELVVATLAAALVTSSFSASVQADQYSDKVFDENNVSGGAMLLDAVVVRPVMLGATIVGGALFVVSAPFALAGGTVHKTLDTLVSVPAENTFIRCLGCTPVQHERVKAERKTEEMQAASGENVSDSGFALKTPRERLARQQ